MFWDKGYAPSANIEALLEKENATVEEFLDEDDILQECKTQKKNIVNYFTRPEVIKRLVQLVTTEPPEDVPMTQRFRYANMASEIMSIGLPSLDEKLMSDPETLQLLISYLEQKPPLNPLLSSFYSKTFSMLFTKKAEQDWFLYQQMCLQLLEYLKKQKNFLDLICKHFDTPVIPDLIMQMMKDVEGGKLKRNLYEWLTEDKLVERLIAILRNPQETDQHANVAEFFCDLIQQGRQMRQTEQENDSFEPAFDGSNPILKNIESAETIEALLNVILEPNAQESVILSGISVVLMLIKPITFTDEPNSDRQKYLQNREREMHLQVQETVINVIAPRLKNFVELLKNPPAKPTIETTACTLSPPFGNTRLQICRIFTALLETKHETISKAICETEYFVLLLDYFKQYCWNNFLHSELEKALHIIFYTQFSNSNNSTAANGNSYEKNMTNFDYVFNCFMKTYDNEADENAKNADVDKNELNQQTTAALIDDDEENKENLDVGENERPIKKMDLEVPNASEQNSTESKVVADAAEAENVEKQQFDSNDNDMPMEADDEVEVEIEVEIEEAIDENKENVPQVSPVEEEALQDEEVRTKETNIDVPPPSEMQIHLIVKCRLITRLIDYWQHNNEIQSAENGRRLGYMGHLIKILGHVTNSITESIHIGALVMNNISDEAELKLWQSIVDPENGNYTKAFNIQNKLLANCNPHEENDYNLSMLKEVVPGDNRNWGDSFENFMNSFNIEHHLFDEEDDDSAAGGDGYGLHTKNSMTLSNLAASVGGGSPWESEDPFSDLSITGGGVINRPGGWNTDMDDNFADFDSHFSTFINDFGGQFGSVDDNARDAGDDDLRPTPTNLGDDEGQQQQLNNSSEDNEIIGGDGGGDNTYNDDDDDDDHHHHHNDENQLQQQHQQLQHANFLSHDLSKDITTTTTTTMPEEYDNNANVEKSKFIEANETLPPPPPLLALPATLTTTTTPIVATSLVSRLQSVLLDGEDDYEDDEGMWTKPLGGGGGVSSAGTANEQLEIEEQQATSIQLMTNGPNSKQLELLNNATDEEKNSAAAALEQKLVTTVNSLQVAASAAAASTTT